MDNKIDLSILIPAYLEEENLRLLLPRIRNAAKGLEITFEIIVVDTMQAKDNTQLACIDNEVTYLNRENGNYYGDAIRTGLHHAKGNHLLFMDADGSHSPEFIKNLYTNRNDNDVVIASRYVEGGGSDNSSVLIWMSWSINFIYSWLFNLQCKDVSNSFKLYKADAMKALNLKCDNFDIIEEILIKLKRNNKYLKITELPYMFKERMFGHTKRNLIVFVFSYIFTLIKLKLRK